MAVVATRLMFQAGSRTIAGNLGGKFLHCTMRPAQGGALPPAGEYEILPPVIDPIYGRLALMTPVGGSGGILAQKHPDKLFNLAAVSDKRFYPPAVSDKVYQKPDAALPALSGKVFPKMSGKLSPAASASFFLKPDAAKFGEKPLATAVSDKFFQKPDASPPSAAGGQVFVLSDRPVLGRNCIVVSSGFADLMDGLQTSGGARVRVG